VDPSDKMTFDELKGVVLQAKALGAKRIVIPGEGEPFLDETLFPLIDFASENGLKITIFTNGSFIDQGAAAHLFGKRVSVIFKLHSLDQSVYDFLAGRSNAANWADYCGAETGHQKTRIPLGLKYLLEAGYRERPLLPLRRSLLQVETVVVRQNLNDIPIIAGLCKKLGIDCVVETLIKTNRAYHKSSILAVAAEEELKLFYDLRGILGWRFSLGQKRRCDFETNPFLDVSGNIRHCFSLAASIGNIREMSLAELHKKELGVREKTGMMSKKFSFNQPGLRCCASRKVIIERDLGGTIAT
jgi:MoaA/NifB/PqqE/SkfB family radical SAM enzyme